MIGGVTVKKLLATVLALALCLSLPAGCSQPAQQTSQPSQSPRTSQAAAEEPYYMAIVAPFTGDNAMYGEFIYHGVMTKVNQVNEAGGINGRKIVVDQYDDKGDSTESATIAQKICDENKYLFVFSSFASGASISSGEVYRKNNMLHFVPTASHANCSVAGGTSWAMSLQADIEYYLLGKALVEDLSGKKIALIHLNADNGFIIRDAVVKGVEEAGGEVVISESYINGQVRDFTSILTKVKAADPDVVCMCVQYADTSAMLIQRAQIGFDDSVIWCVNNDNFVDTFLTSAGEAAEGVYCESIWSCFSSDEDIVKFRARYNDMWDGEEPSPYSVQPYEAMCMMVDALEQGIDTTQGLQDYMTELGYWDGETMAGEFGENQRLVRDRVYMHIVKDGVFEAVE